MKNTNFEGLDLRGKNLEGANLENYSFIGSDIRGVNLSKANLRGADFREANLEGVKLSGAELEGAEGLQVFSIGDNNILAFAYTYDSERRYQIGDFNGNYDETLYKIRSENGNNSRYEKIINAYLM